MIPNNFVSSGNICHKIEELQFSKCYVNPLIPSLAYSGSCHFILHVCLCM